MRAAAALAFVVVLGWPSPASAQLIPTTTTTAAPPTTEVPTTTTAPAETTTTTAAPAATTAPPATEAPAATTTAPPAETTTTFPIPAGDPGAGDDEARDAPLEAKTGLLPWLVALSLGGFGVAAIIVGQQAWATRPRRRAS